MPRRVTQDGHVMVQGSDRMWSTRERNGKPLQYSCLENCMNSMKRQKDRTLKDELPRLVGAQYATGDQWRNNSRKNEGMEPKQKQHPVVNGTGHRSKVRCCREQYCIGTWNVRSMNQGKLEVVNRQLYEYPAYLPIYPLKDELPRSVSGYYATGIRGEITPERMKRWSQSKNNTQL